MANLITSFFSSPIFTWWNTATFGTRLFTSRKGVKVGEDSQGNVYYQERDGKRRWVIYKNGPVEASRVPADWHGWLHYTVDDIPSGEPISDKTWIKDHAPNLTGSDNAYFPAGSLNNLATDRAASTSDYEAWRPE